MVFLALQILQGINESMIEQYGFKNDMIKIPFSQKVWYRKVWLYQNIVYISMINQRIIQIRTQIPRPIAKPLLDKKISCSISHDKDMTVYESLMLCKGKLSRIQYIPLKRAGFGIKSRVWMKIWVFGLS